MHGQGLSENDMAAFAAAKGAGFGIECDVRLSGDGVAIVFHDAMIDRMTGQTGVLGALPASTIADLALPDGGAVPTLAALLDLCGDSVPLLIEMKVDGRHAAPLCAAVARDLSARPRARAAVMSFNPLAMRWFARRRPDAVRGLVVTQQGKGRIGAIQRALALCVAKPDFLACDIRDLPTRLSVRARRKGMPVLTWTVRNESDRARAAAHADQIIFERADG
jgi:glycerophosphoryl diester phosphodiesterase